MQLENFRQIKEQKLMRKHLQELFDTEEQVEKLLSGITSDHSELQAFAQSEHVKTLIEWTTTFVGREHLAVDLLLRDSFMQIYGLGTEWLPVRLRIVYGYKYPQSRPRLYFESDNMNLFYTISGRDYMKQVAPNWSQSSTMLDLLQYLAGFLQALEKLEQPHRLGTYVRGEFLQIQSLQFSEASEVYRVKIIMDELLDRYVVLNRFDMMLFQRCPIPGFMRLIEVYSLKSITSIHNSKDNSEKIVMLLKLGSLQMGCELLTEQRQRFITSIIDKKLKSPNYEMQQALKPQLNPQPIGLETIKRQIAIQQSKLSQEDFEQISIDTLVCLYNQAIEYCSLTSDTAHEEYLEKLQRLLSRQSSHLNQKQSIFPELKQIKKEEKQNVYYDKLHDLSQVTCASSDLFDLA